MVVRFVLLGCLLFVIAELFNKYFHTDIEKNNRSSGLLPVID